MNSAGEYYALFQLCCVVDLVCFALFQMHQLASANPNMQEKSQYCLSEKQMVSKVMPELTKEK
jgi:hypothetical protein